VSEILGQNWGSICMIWARLGFCLCVVSRSRGVSAVQTPRAEPSSFKRSYGLESRWGFLSS